MRRTSNVIPDYLKYGSYMIANNASTSETAVAFGTTTAKVRDCLNHSLKKNVPVMYNHVQNIHTAKKAQ